MITLRSLKIFATLATYKNMTKTAEKLFITQSSISQVISSIEEEYGVVLFERMKNGLVLTNVGEKMLKYSKNILASYDELEQVLQNDSDIPYIRIGASTAVGSTILRNILEEFLREHKNLQYFSFIENTRQIEEKILNNEIDIGIVDGIISSKDIVCETLLEDKMVLICSPKHKFYGRKSVTLKEIAKEPLVLREETSGTRKQLTDRLKKQGLEYNCVWSCANTAVVKAAVCENLGVSVISYRQASEELSNGQLWACEISDEKLIRTFRLVYHKDKYFTKTMDEFVRLAKKQTIKYKHEEEQKSA